MPLELYSEQYFYPDTSLAASISYQVFPDNQNLFAPLWQDAAGTIPLPNPGTTSPTGFVTFYAEAGPYWLHLDTETFRIDVGVSQEQADLSTGVASGGDLNPNVGNPLAIDIEPLTGYIVDNTNEFPLPPVIQYVDHPGSTWVLDGPAQLRTITYWLMDSAQNVTQQATYPTPLQFRQFLVLGVSAFDTVSGMIIETQTLPTILPQPANQLVDLMDGMGPFSLNGNDVSAATAPGMMLSKTAGEVFARAFNYVSGGVVTDNPHISMSPAQDPVTFRRIVRTAGVPTPPPVLTIDAANYDVGGVITPVVGGPNVSTVQRIYLFAANTSSLQVAVQYGQTTYPDLITAVASVTSGNEFIAAPVTRLGSLIGYLAVTSGATNLQDQAQATFVHAGKFATP